VDGLRAAIGLVNDKRGALGRLAALRAADPAPISGLDALLINQVSFYDDPVRFTGSVNRVADELEARVKAGTGVKPKGSTRLVVSGCPMAVPNWKLPFIVESLGAVIVGEESCVGERNTRNLVNPEGSTLEELLDALVDRYFQIDCAIFTPNPDRARHVREIARATGAKGVLHYALNFCQPYQMEAIPLVKGLQTDGVPALSLETDYSSGDVAQLKTRVEAFLEMIG
jgi:benzoyl-CoA reductase/2-hydroxyglutaryl-CoA dehydratase subunit BcrC/BadD/HgdB